MVAVVWVVLSATIRIIGMPAWVHAASIFWDVPYATNLVAAANNVTGVLSGAGITTESEF